MHYHIVGIAGAGMSAIAHILLDQGHTVSGSDARGGPAADALAARGARVARGHDPAYVAGADALLTTSAAPADHPELAAARAASIPVLKRADLWRQWSQERQIVAVAGTHGKTTTTAMLALILLRAGREPGFLVGGEAPDLGGSARWGSPAAPLVIEADEYDRTFLALTPAVAVITNVEWDHVDIYPTPASYDEAFRAFAASVAQPADLVLCGDDPGVERAIDAPAATRYGIDEALARDPVSCRRIPLDWSASGVRPADGGMRFDLWRYDPRTLATRMLGERRLRLPGAHNVRNALAATAAAHALGVDPATIAAALADYRGAGRRFELKGEAGGVTVIDDYAHHPTEVRATLAAARDRYGARRLVVYFQPHTYSRTRALLPAWAEAFEAADVVRIGAIYAAREHDTLGMSAEALAARVRAPDVQAVGDGAAAAAALLALLRPGDVLLTLGAGDSDQVGAAVLRQLAGER
jgi:UDP-N-acetylmuramate--alanine ligase